MCVSNYCRGSDLYVGNVGDSRCIACIDGVADPLSVDHKPSDPLEKARIVNAGGFVELNRVNGNLALRYTHYHFRISGVPEDPGPPVSNPERSGQVSSRKML